MFQLQVFLKNIVGILQCLFYFDYQQHFLQELRSILRKRRMANDNLFENRKTMTQKENVNSKN